MLARVTLDADSNSAPEEAKRVASPSVRALGARYYSVDLTVHEEILQSLRIIWDVTATFCKRHFDIIQYLVLLKRYARQSPCARLELVFCCSGLLGGVVDEIEFAYVRMCRIRQPFGGHLCSDGSPLTRRRGWGLCVAASAALGLGGATPSTQVA
ncbi:hypothetical protein BC834DRAFT_661620 [Gloeopeniophorella convolvens]|nr:hypothetical protein BC834DRAFT_661620 [Gloeopeniophorella convolvens]